jgi:2-methylcitrate dehydratase PrpD
MAVTRALCLSVCLAGLLTATPISAQVASTCVPGPPSPLLDRSIAGALGQAITDTRFETISPQVLHRTKLTVLDNIATLAYTNKAMRTNPYLARATVRGGRREARVIGTGLQIPVEDAAATNAWLIHAAETDDSDFRASLRASPVVMGPALAMASAQHSSGKDFLLALSVGHTVLGRVAEPLGPLQLRDWMSSGVWGPTSSAAVSAKLLGLDGVATGNAIALAAGAGGGAFQYFYDQTEDKRMVVARAARAGVEAAMLACQGEIGAPRIFEGRAGLYANMGASPSQMPTPSSLVQDFSRLEGPLRLAPKFYAASASIIPFLDAIAQNQTLVATNPQDIIGIEISGGNDAARIYQDKIDKYAPPTTLIGAKTSLPFVLAMFLTDKSADTYDFSMSRLSDTSLNDLARKTRFRLVQAEPTRLTIQLRSGETVMLEPKDSDGRTDEPEMAAARLAKFQSLTRETLTDAQRARVIRQVENLDQVSDMSVWLANIDRLLRANARL